MVPQLDRAVPLKARACEGTSEGSSTEVFMLGYALCRSNSSSAKIRPLRLHFKLEEILHSTCRAPLLFVGVELVRSKGSILNLVQHSGDSSSGLLRGCGVEVDKS